MKKELTKVIRINKLIDIYSPLLTQKQKDVMFDYYECNLSLSEISEMRKISKTAVGDMIKQTEEKLESFEKKMSLLKIFEEQINKGNDKVIKEIIESIKNGI